MASGTRSARLRILEDDSVSKRKTKKLKKSCGVPPLNTAEILELRKMIALKNKEIAAAAETTGKESAGTIVTPDILSIDQTAEIEKLKTALTASEQQHKAELDELKKQLEQSQASSSQELTNAEQMEKVMRTDPWLLKLDEFCNLGFGIFRDAALRRISDPAVRPILEQLEYNVAVDEILDEYSN